MKRLFSVLVASLISTSLWTMPIAAHAAHGSHGSHGSHATHAHAAHGGHGAREAGSKHSSKARELKSQSSAARAGRKSASRTKDSGSRKHSARNTEGRAERRQASQAESSKERDETAARAAKLARQREEDAAALALWKNTPAIRPSLPSQDMEPEPATQRAITSTSRPVPSVRLPEPAEVAVPAASVVRPIQPSSPGQASLGERLAIATTPVRPSKGVPPRAYAMDGATFYQNGKKIRVKGMDVSDPSISSEHAKQRLQWALDSGMVTLDEVNTDRTGQSIAVVRVNGRDLAEILREGH